MKKQNKSWAADAGCSAPQLLIQITPLKWGIGGVIGPGKIGLVLGPISAVFFFWYGRWSAKLGSEE